MFERFFSTSKIVFGAPHTFGFELLPSIIGSPVPRLPTPTSRWSGSLVSAGAGGLCVSGCVVGFAGPVASAGASSCD